MTEGVLGSIDKIWQAFYDAGLQKHHERLADRTLVTSTASLAECIMGPHRQGREVR
jgi:hypothetical protein